LLEYELEEKLEACIPYDKQKGEINMQIKFQNGTSAIGQSKNKTGITLLIECEDSDDVDWAQLPFVLNKTAENFKLIPCQKEGKCNDFYYNLFLNNNELLVNTMVKLRSYLPKNTVCMTEC
jgi:hypothetical protein